MRVCNNCGYLNNDNAMFCSQCGGQDLKLPDNNTIGDLATSTNYSEINNRSYERLNRFNTSIFKIFAIISIPISIFLVVYFYKDMGLFTLIFPLILYGSLTVFYIKEKIKHKFFYSLNDVANKSISKK